jgi:hypothetical protein
MMNGGFESGHDEFDSKDGREELERKNLSVEAGMSENHFGTLILEK